MSTAPSPAGGSGSQATYDSAALDYRAASDRFWGFLSLRTIDRMALEPGQRVLDVASGPGVSTVAAAERVGPEGRVIALDSSEQMLRMARERADSRHLENVEVRVGDMAQLDFPEASFDAVVSILGIFFVPDMPALVSDLWRLLAPGGQLAITTLGKGAFEPAIGLWKEAVRAERPNASLTFPWERTDDPDGLGALLETAGVASPSVHTEPHEVSISTVDDWWLAVMGSGMRRTVLEMDDAATERVRERCDRALRDAGVTTMQVPGIYALTTKG